MNILHRAQIAPISDAYRSKLAMVVAVLEATLLSLKRDRIERLGGLNQITVYDLSREFLKGSGDAGICFEHSVHQAIERRDPLIEPLIHEVLESFCSIKGEVSSILFGPEKDGLIPLLQTTQDSLTDSSTLYIGGPGRPRIKLKSHVPLIIAAFRSNEARTQLPRSIKGLWKADLFVGSPDDDRWVGTSVKIKSSDLEAAQGLRIGLYPKRNAQDTPRRDEDLNLIRVPLPYDMEFMEVFWKAFQLTRAFMRADAYLPQPVDLPDSEDRLICKELQARRTYPLLQVLEVLRGMSQSNLLTEPEAEELRADASISENGGFDPNDNRLLSPNLITIAPAPTIHSE